MSQTAARIAYQPELIERSVAEQLALNRRVVAAADDEGLRDHVHPTRWERRGFNAEAAAPHRSQQGCLTRNVERRRARPSSLPNARTEPDPRAALQTEEEPFPWVDDLDARGIRLSRKERGRGRL
jgi:hypothetical protein